MHVLFVHQNYPAQFGHIARYLVEAHGFQCTFVSERPAGTDAGVRRIQYQVKGGASKQNHYCSRSFENYIWHTHAVYDAMKAAADVRPDLVVGHSGFGSTLFLRELYDCPILNYFEYYYRPHNSDMDFRPEWPPLELDILRSYARDAMLLLDLQNCNAGYSPTQWQRELFPKPYQDKISTIFDGVDMQVWNRRPAGERRPRVVAGRTIPDDLKLVTYAARGFESMRGFDIFMRVAKRIAEFRNDVLFVCVGSDRICYGGDNKHITATSFREHVLSQDTYDLDRFFFPGILPPEELASLFQISDLHLYLTVPFVLSWSLMNALACGCLVLASDTAPVQEMIRHGENGLLAGFFDVDRFVELALDALDHPERHAPLRERAHAMIRDEYALDRVLPRMLKLYERMTGG